ncbi:PD-(D/E)XK nuclease family protein [uncultured Hymenobacter sp.]|uniref:PDDEXK-like family protein n=1 Tax=uncultured Hymenobacter sp. TaxID=170016 RepID=UPI0035CA9D87
MTTELQSLLNKLDAIQLRQKLTQPKDAFNIFSILRNDSDEVNLHSRFLYELLNPLGSHGMGSKFLQLFAEQCKLPALNYDTVQVLREHANIDILIQDNQNAVVVENKIYASDQFQQLKRYCNYAIDSNRNPILLYLTLDGREPSDWSVGNMQKKINLISYSSEIGHWLINCIKEAATQPGVRETLIQYQNLVDHLTGKNMNKTEEHDVVRLMAEGKNAEYAMIIARNWNHVRWHTEWNFWTDLSTALSSDYNYPISSDGKFSEDKISVMVHANRNRDPHYGLMIKLGHFDGIQIKFKIDRGWETVYYGILKCAVKDNFDVNINEDVTRAIQSITSAQDERWLGYKEAEGNINFRSFDTQSTLELANPDKRRIIIGKLSQEIDTFIKQSTLLLKSISTREFTASNLLISS